MRAIIRTFLIFYQFWVIVCLSLCFLFVFISSILMIPFKHNRIYVQKIVVYFSRLWFILIGIKVKDTYEAPNAKHMKHPKNVIFVSNHISYLDIPTLCSARLPTFVFLSKIELLSIPLFGYICSLLAVTVKRENFDSRYKSIEEMQLLLTKEHIGLCIFPEGTFNETKQDFLPFKIGAFSLAIKTQTPIYPILLIDTVNRMHYSHLLSFTPGKNEIYHLNPIKEHIKSEMTPIKLMKFTLEKMQKAFYNKRTP